MFDRPIVLPVAACATLLVLISAPIVQARQSIVANDPITLEPVSPQPATVQPITPETPRIAPDETGNARTSPSIPFVTLPPALRSLPDPKRIVPGETRDAVVAAPPASAVAAGETLKSPGESKPLGRANGALSVRPVEPAKTATTSMLGKLDPRTNEITRVCGALAVVIGLLILARTVVRRMGGGVIGLGAGAGQPSGVVEILARFPVSRGQNLVLLKLARRILLLHQSGANMTTLSEMNDPDEVASLLSRMEAGSSGRGAAKFKAALSEFEAEHQALLNDAPRVRRALLPEMETEIIDLTRSNGRSIGNLFGLARRIAK